MPRDDGRRASSRRLGEHYKAEIIASIPDRDEISLYGQGDWDRPLPRAARAVDRQAQGASS